VGGERKYPEESRGEGESCEGQVRQPILYLSVLIPIVFQGKDDRSRLVEAGSAGEYILRRKPLSLLSQS